MACSIIRNRENNSIEKVMAPNGKESKLYKDILSIQSDPELALKLWAQVYTPSFKNWFGNWENKEGSKVVDDNGEPLLVYHGSGQKFNAFIPNELGITYFTSNYGYSKIFAERQKDSLEFLKIIYNEKLKDLTAVQDALGANEEYPWLYQAIENLSKESNYTAQQIVDLIYKNINDPSFFEPDYERMYIQDSGDEGADYYDRPETQEEEEAYRNYELQKKKDIENKESEVYRLLALSDKASDIIFALENNISTEESDIVRSAEKYNKKNPEETIYPVFLNIKNPQYENSISNENIKEGLIKLSKTSDGLIGTDSALDIRHRGNKVSFNNVNVYGVYEPNQIKSAFNEGTYSTAKDNIYLQKEGTTVSSKASPKTIAIIKDFLKRIGVNATSVQNIVIDGVKQDANAVALTMQKLIQVVQGKEAISLPEEAMHFAVEIIKQTNPALYNQLLKEINNYALTKQVFADYSSNPAYQTKDGKPDVIKLKEEAMAKVLAEVIIKQAEEINEKPELLAKTETLWNKIVNFLKNLFIKSGFDSLALDIISGKDIGTAEDIENGETFLQQAQQSNQDKIFDSMRNLDSRITLNEDDNNYYIDGKQIGRRVSSLVTDWYERRFREQALDESDFAKAILSEKADKGTAGHADFEYAFTLFVNQDGTLKSYDEIEKILANDNYTSLINPENNDMYELLRDNLLSRLRSFPIGTKFMSEVTIYDETRDIAGTVDFLAITPEGKVNILDWKFMDLNIEKYTDIPWYKVGAWNIQMEQYKYIISKTYGVKSENFEQTRMIPIKATYSKPNYKDEILPKLLGIKIGDVNVSNIEEDYLIPVGLQAEKTGSDAIDALLEKLNAIYKKLSEERVLPTDKDTKAEQLNALFYAIRQLQMKKNIGPLIYQAKVLNKQVKNILNKYAVDFKGKDIATIDKDTISPFTASIGTAREALDTYTNLDIELEFLFQDEYGIDIEDDDLSDEDKALKADLAKAVAEARKYTKLLEKLDTEFTTNVIGKSEGVENLNIGEKVVRGLTKYFGTTSTIQLKALQLLFKKAGKALGFASMDVNTEIKRLSDIKSKYEEWSRGKGLNIKNMFDILKKKNKNELIDEFNSEFYKKLRKAIDTKDFEWIADNIDEAAYQVAIDKKLEEEFARIEAKPRAGTDREISAEIKREKEKAENLYNIDNETSPGWLMYTMINKFPKRDKWESTEWKELHAKGNEPALDFYNYIKERNEYYQSIGYINALQARTFLPWVRKGLVEKLIFGGKISMGEQFLRNITLSEGDTGFGQVNPLTGELVDTVPIHLTRELDEEVSTDLFKTMATYNEFAIKYKYLKEIEEQARALVRLEKLKKSISTSFFGKTQREGGILKYNPDNKENTKLVQDMVKAIVYQQKYIESETFDQVLGTLGGFGKTLNKKLGFKLLPENLEGRQLSINKIVTQLNNTFQMKALGLNVLSSMSNFFGGTAQSYINAGKYFTKSDFVSTEMWILANKFNGSDKKKMMAALNYFLPFTDNYNKELANELSLSKFNDESIQNFLMVLMRQGDKAVQVVNFFSYLKNSIVIDGEIKNTREYLKSTPEYENFYEGTQLERDTKEKKFEEDVKKLNEEKGVLALSTVNDNNEFVIPGIERKSDSVLSLRRVVQKITGDALGSMTEENRRLMNMTIYGNSLMIFKNWIPRLVDVRFGNIKYNSASDAYEWGRMRTIARVVKEDLMGSIGNLYNSLKGNDKGVAFLRQLYDKKRADYESDTGKTLDMTEDQFINLVRENISNQSYDVVFYALMLSLVAGLKALPPDDDEDPLVKNQWKYLLKATDKFKDEIAYFYDPTSATSLVSSGIFPGISLITDYKNVLTHFFAENLALIQGDDEAAEKNKVLKYVMKAFPISSQAAGLLPMFYPELAKDLGLRMQSQYGIR